MGENFRAIPVPENSVLSCGVGRDVVSGDNFQQPARVSLPVSEGGACDDQGKHFVWKFHLKGIPPMPRDAFEIDVDANGILKRGGTFVSGQSVNASNAPCLHGWSLQAILCL